MFLFGVDYYPEQWPEARWPIDARLMQEAGFNVVRLAEFAWAKLEPVEGTFDFDWLDRAMDCLQEHGMRVILGTPTASPPPWVMRTSPDLFRVQQDGHRLTFGNRRENCPNQPLYREHCRRIVTAMAEHYARHPGVVGWQIDNEFGDRCYCETCRQAFHGWLRTRYGSLDGLNRRWGTIFWSHTYRDWAEIPTPLKTGGSPNPGLALDYFRFCSDSYVTFQKEQIDILREKSPGHLITHDLMGFDYERLNYFDLAGELDIVSLNVYPRSQFSKTPCMAPEELALTHATMRGLKGKNFWVMEQQSGPGGWEMISTPPRPGEMRRWAYQSIAHGAEAILFFRWRSARYGTEQYWHGLLDHDGHPGRRYAEARRMGMELQRAGERIAGSEVRSPVAMVLSYDSRFAFEIQPNHPEFRYSDHFKGVYRAFHDAQVSVDIVPPEADLSPYRLVVAPALHLLPEECAEKLKKYVEEGGVLLVTQRSGVKDDSNAIVNQRLPGRLAGLCGVEVEEVDSFSGSMQNAVRFVLPNAAHQDLLPVGILCEILQPVTARTAAVYTADFYAGQPAITVNALGKGQAIYAGAMGGPAFYRALVEWLLPLSRIRSTQFPCEGLEIRERWQGSDRVVFILNHSGCPQKIVLEHAYTNLLDGNRLADEILIEPNEVYVLVE